MTPEEKLFAKYEKCRVMLVGFNPPEVKQLKGWFFEKHNKNLTEIRDAASAWQKFDLASFHFIIIKEGEENEELLSKLVESNRFQRTPIILFSKTPDVFANSYAKRDMIGRFCKLPVNLNELEASFVGILKGGVAEANAPRGGAGAFANYNNGCRALEEGRLAEAKEEFRLCLKENPGFFDAYLKMGETLAALGEGDAAARVLHRAGEIRPDDSRAPFLLGLVELKKGDAAKATEMFDKAVAIEPRNVGLIIGVGNAFLEKNMIEEALRYFNMARDLSPDFLQVYNRLGITLSRAGRFGESETMYNRALELDKDDPGIHFNLGMMWGRKGDKEKAREKFKKCIELNPGMTAAKEMLAKT
ncbi:MAG: tetratricopeptide repeat protein [Nitrospinae bacterium]|nr:tetratricopeptide repeat protein [Nitrospinota bacterium]